MEYLDKVLGVKVTYEDVEFKHLPNFIAARYRLQMVSINEQKVKKIPFIVEGKQIYLPFMALYLQERCSSEKKSQEEILPSAQMLLLHFIYGGARELSTSQAAKDLELTPTSISRASRQLEEMLNELWRKIGGYRN